jgi:Ca-activated chloride channel family protein
MSDFHFLRPDWLWALIPAAAVVLLAWRGQAGAGDRAWSGTVDAHLLKYLTVGGAASRPSHRLIAALAAGLVAAVLAVAGPAWEKLPTPTTRGAEPVVVVLSLAQSMNGTDLVPSRLARAGHKLRDVLDRAEGEDVGLVIYADHPFVAAPLTPDAAVILEMLPELSTSLMPVLGNRLDRAVAEAHDLLASAGATRGRILVMADDMGTDPEASLSAARFAHADGYAVSVLGVGTPEGAALQTADGRAIRVGGDTPVARLDRAAMQGLAATGGGRYAEVTATSADLDRLLPAPLASSEFGQLTDLKADRWHDRGYLLLLVPVLLMPLAFRRGVLFAVAMAFVGLSGAPGPARAAGLDDLWATPDQQGARAFASGDYAAAAGAFASPEWRAGALYRAGDYDAAAAVFGDDAYNAGNALARAGRLEEAIAAYDKRLAQAPDDADAQFNRDLVAQLLEEQKKDEEDQQQDGQSGQDQQSQDGQSGQNQQQGDPSGGAEQQAGDNGAGQPQGGESGDDRQAASPSEEGQDPGQQEPRDQQNGQPDGTPQAPDRSGELLQADGQPAGEPMDAGERPGETAADQPQTGQPGAEPTRPETAQAHSGGNEPEGAAPDAASEEKGVLSAMIDQLLQGNGAENESAEAPEAAASVAGTPLSQSAEQQLRAVPDDPAGLLRARIRQHYAQLRANGQ